GMAARRSVVRSLMFQSKPRRGHLKNSRYTSSGSCGPTRAPSPAGAPGQAMTTKRNPVRAFLIVALVLVAATAAPRPVQAADPAGNNGWQRTLKPDGFVMQLGRAKETTTATIGLKWDWHRSWRLGRRTWVTGYNELSIGHW